MLREAFAVADHDVAFSHPLGGDNVGSQGVELFSAHFLDFFLPLCKRPSTQFFDFELFGAEKSNVSAASGIVLDSLNYLFCFIHAIEINDSDSSLVSASSVSDTDCA